MNKPVNSGKTMLERHIQTVLLSLITAGIIFSASQLFALSASMVEVRTKLETLMAQSQNFITLEQVSTMSKMRDQQLNELSRRIQQNETDIEELKDAQRK